jgi:putative FmdB family regulatory protein
MPLYEYTCNDCHRDFVILQRLGATEEDTFCIACSSPNVKKKISLISANQRIFGGGSFSSGHSF